MGEQFPPGGKIFHLFRSLFQSVSWIDDMNVSLYIIWPSWKAFKMVIPFGNCIWSGKKAIHIHVIIYHQLIHFWFSKIIYIFLQQFTHWISEKECKIQQNILHLYIKWRIDIYHLHKLFTWNYLIFIANLLDNSNIMLSKLLNKNKWFHVNNTLIWSQWLLHDCWRNIR